VDPVANAALTSWSLNPAVILLLLFCAVVYVRGWMRGRRLLRAASDGTALVAFLFGLLALFLATESPLDTFDTLYLSAHMTQHLLLMMIAPPLILLGRPLLPLLRGLPKSFVKEGLGPFLSWPFLRNVGALLTAPPVAWIAFAFSTVFWHVPALYELTLHDPFWHSVEHACFFWTGILFWWSVVEPTPAKPFWPGWSKIPYLLFADIVNTALSAFFVFSGRILYPTYEIVRPGGLSAQADQTLAGLIMWVPGSLVYLVPAFFLVMRLFSSGAAHTPAVQRVRRVTRVRRRLPIWRWRRFGQAVMLALAIIIITDGWFGPSVAPLNLAGVLPWIQWRAFSIVALLLVGNLFCMVCPFTFVRDIGRKFLPANRRWPRQLRNKWLPVALLVLYFWAYEAFSLWDRPGATAALITAYFLAAIAIDGFFRGASFCKYVCPIGQYHFVASLVSPREVRVRTQETCRSCRTHDCIRGNAQARGCELYLFQPKKASNLDCTFCLDCVKACPHDNVSILPVVPAKTLTEDSYHSSLGRLSKRTDLAALALVFVFAAFANAAGMIGPVMMLRGRLLMLAAALVLPAVVILLLTSSSLSARRLIFALVPLGTAMWATHLLYHLATTWQGPWLILTHRILNWRDTIAMGPVPHELTAFQILILDAGLLATLLVAWRISRQSTRRLQDAVLMLTPWALLAASLYVFGIWVFFQPMQMRGMLM
jgi:cytochrome c oxidase assembly factor CtaG/polyferredoxin